MTREHRNHLQIGIDELVANSIERELHNIKYLLSRNIYS